MEPAHRGTTGALSPDHFLASARAHVSRHCRVAEHRPVYGSAVLEAAAERQGDMMDRGSTARLSSTVDDRVTGGLLLADQLAIEVKRQWHQGEPADLAAVLAEHPELHGYR